MKYAYLAALALGLCSTAALAQGNSPYNSSGQQAGGPLAGQERAMGAGGGTPATGKPMMRSKKMKRRGRM